MTSLGELKEKYNLRKVCYAIENLDTIVNKKSNKNPTYIKQTLLKILLKYGEIDVAYHYSTGANFGRQYSHSAMQSLDKNTRNFLLNGENITDIDIVSSAPSTLKYLAEQYEVTKIPCLTEYVADKYAVMKKYEITKQEVNYLLFEENKKELNKKWLRDFQDEIFRITERLIKHKDFANIKKYVVKKKGVGKDASLLANILFKYENQFLMEIKKHIEKELEVFALEFDGLKVYDLPDEYKETWSDFNKELQELTGNPYLKVAIKPIDTTIVIPDEYFYTAEKRNELLRKYSRDYETVKMMWEDVNEKNATLITSGSQYFLKENGKWSAFQENSLRVSYRHKKYEETAINKDGTIVVVEKCFIDKWIDDENIQKKTKIVNYFDNSLVGENDLNICVPFDVNTWELDNYKYDERAVTIFRTHIKSLCNFEEKPSQFIEKWLGHVFQMPDTKTGVCIIMTGEEGTGKDTFTDIIASIMGRQRRFITASPENDVWGRFNSMMANCCFVQLSEIDRMNTNAYMGKIKDIITNPTINIEDKGLKPYTTQSNHNFIIPTNNDLPINLSKKQRRFCIVSTSSINIGNKAYFAELFKIMEDKNALKSIYEYFMNLKDVPEKFSVDDINVSLYQEEMKKNCVEDIIEFMKYRCIEKKTEIENIMSIDLLKEFSTWRIVNKLPNREWNCKSFGIRMSKMMIENQNCISKERTMIGVRYMFDYTKLYKAWELENEIDK
jgi:hypothetical protein